VKVMITAIAWNLSLQLKVIATGALGAARNRAALGRPPYVVAAVKSPVVAQSLLVEPTHIDASRLRSFKAAVSPSC
jgi:hypothetical protein